MLHDPIHLHQRPTYDGEASLKKAQKPQKLALGCSSLLTYVIYRLGGRTDKLESQQV